MAAPRTSSVPRPPPSAPSSLRRTRRRAPVRRAEEEPPDSTHDDPAVAVPRALKAIGSVVAPASLLTALMYYFGVQHAHFYFAYFGVNYTVMGLTTQDFLVRSVDGLFLPLAAIAAGVLAALWAYRAGNGRLTGPTLRAVQRRAGILALGVGLLALGVALVGVLRPDTFDSVYGLPGVCLAAGVLLLALASHLVRSARPSSFAPAPPWLAVSEWSALFVVVSVGLFWAVTDYSSVVGGTRAQQTERELADAPDAVLYSTERLSLPPLAADEVVCGPPDDDGGGYRYRYENLTLVFASADQYLFLPVGWPEDGGTAIVLPRSDSLRLEFVPLDLRQGATC